MDQEILKLLREQKDLIDKVYVSAEKTRKYFLWTLIVTLLVIVLPLIGMIFVIPSFISTYAGMMGGLGI